MLELKSAVNVDIRDSTLIKIEFVRDASTIVRVAAIGLYIGYALNGVTTILNIHTMMKNVTRLVEDKGLV